MKNIRRNILNAMILVVICLLFIYRAAYSIVTGTSDKSLDINIGVILIFSILIIALLYRSIVWQRNKNIRIYIKSHSSPYLAREKVCYFLKNAPYIHTMQYDKEFISGRDFFGLEFVEVKNIYAYRRCSKLVRKWSIPVFKTNSLELITKNGTNVTLSFRFEQEVFDVMHVLTQQYPNLYRMESRYR